MMKQAFGYVRVSTTGQAVDGVSLEAQRARIEAYCLLNELELAAVFVDAGLSGKRADNRPELQNALNAVCQAGGVLVCYSLSRLARSTKDTIAISERLDKAGADLVSLSEKIDTTSAAGKMVFRMLAVMAEFERDVISERTTTAMAHKKSQGERVGEIPFGYQLAADGVALVACEKEQAVIQTIQSLRDKGLSLRAIAAELEAAGLEAKKAKRWNAVTISNILKRTA
jgi:DNA invertase Pin-like site-specific DNA recombinase